jgi:hypothetical protein
MFTRIEVRIENRSRASDCNRLRHPPSSQQVECSKTRLFHALFNALLPRQICDKEVSLLEDKLQSFHDLVEATCSTSLLGKSDHTKVASPASFEDSEQMRVKVDWFEM